MIICRKCQRHHPDDVGRGPCECGADLSRDGIALGGAPAAGASAFDGGGDPFADPFADDVFGGDQPAATATQPAPDPAPPAPSPATQPSAPPAPPSSAPAPPPPAAPPAAPPASQPSVPAPPPAATTTAPVPSPPQEAAASAVSSPLSDLPPPPSSAPADTGEQTAPAPIVRPDLPPPPEPKRRARSFNPADLPAEPDEPAVVAPTEPEVAVVAETAEVEAARPARARGVTPDEVMAAQEDLDAANVGLLPAETVQVPDQAITEPVPVGPRPPGRGEMACPTCQEPNAVTRRFCFNCGAGLPTLESDDEDLAPMTGPARRGVLSRLTGSRLGSDTARTFRGRAKQAGGGQFRYAQGLSPMAKVRLAMMVLGGGGAALMLAGPYRGYITKFIGTGPQGTSPESAEIVDAVEFPNYPADHAVDGKAETGFAFFWDPDGEHADLVLAAEDEAEPPVDAEGEPPVDPAEEPAEAPADGAEPPAEAPVVEPDPREPGTLVVRLEEAMTVNKLYIAGGLPDSETEGPLLLRPSRINVCGEDSCQELTLENSTSQKKYKVNLGEVLVLRITLLDAHDTDTETYPLAVIGEIRVGK